MCTRKECFDRLHAAAPYIKKEYGVKSMRVFGSMARGDNHEGSDVDIFVEMPSADPFKSIDLQLYLEDILGVDVDLICKHRHMNAFFISQIEKDGIYVIHES